MKKTHFIHIPKNGGMTIRNSEHLEEYITTSSPELFVSKTYQKNLLKTMERYGEHHGYEHARWRDLCPAVQNGPCFAVVRNPWSKVVSRYTFLLSLFKHGNKRVHESPYYQKKSFEEFLEEREEWGGREFFWHRAIKGWFPQKDHVTDEEGILRADILRLEHLNQDLNAYFSLNVDFAQRNISNISRVDYKTFYTPTTKKIISEWYGEDIEFFGFTFEGTATKNIWNKQ